MEYFVQGIESTPAVNTITNPDNVDITVVCSDGWRSSACTNEAGAMAEYEAHLLEVQGG
jgi:hypothetical protein